MQGEGDASQGIAAEEYVANVTAAARLFGGGKFCVPLETWFQGKVSPEIRDAQSRLQAMLKPGPDFDQLNEPYRQADNTHFNEAGVQKVAELWAACL